MAICSTISVVISINFNQGLYVQRHKKGVVCNGHTHIFKDGNMIIQVNQLQERSQ